MNDVSFMSFKIVKKYSSTEGWFQMGTLSLSLSCMVRRYVSPFSLYLIYLSIPLSPWVGGVVTKGVCVDRPLILHTAGKLYLCVYGVVLERGVVPHQSHDLLIKDHPYRHN